MRFAEPWQPHKTSVSSPRPINPLENSIQSCHVIQGNQARPWVHGYQIKPCNYYVTSLVPYAQWHLADPMHSLQIYQHPIMRLQYRMHIICLITTWMTQCLPCNRTLRACHLMSVYRLKFNFVRRVEVAHPSSHTEIPNVGVVITWQIPCLYSMKLHKSSFQKDANVCLTSYIRVSILNNVSWQLLKWL